MLYSLGRLKKILMRAKKSFEANALYWFRRSRDPFLFVVHEPPVIPEDQMTFKPPPQFFREVM
jgi:hypothetical protein